MGHILGPKCHVSIATLVRFLLAMAMEIGAREGGPFPLKFAFFGHSRPRGNTISPWGKKPSQGEGAILVADDQVSIALGFPICFSGLAAVLQLTVRATLPNFVFLAVLFCPVV